MELRQFPRPTAVNGTEEDSSGQLSLCIASLTQALTVGSRLANRSSYRIAGYQNGIVPLVTCVPFSAYQERKRTYSFSGSIRIRKRRTCFDGSTSESDFRTLLSLERPDRRTCMAKCSQCGANTQLFVNETPICLGCAREVQLQSPKSSKKETKEEAPEGLIIAG
jgi:hypothetical protein